MVIFYVIVDITILQYNRQLFSIEPQFKDFQFLKSAFEWLDNNTEKESVVLAMITRYDSISNQVIISTDNLIPIYTNNNVYWSHHAQFYPIPSQEELQDRLYNFMYFIGVTSQKDFEEFTKTTAIPTSFEIYQKKLHRDLLSELKKYRINYLFYGPRERESFKINPETYSFLQKVYDDNIVKIYKIL